MSDEIAPAPQIIPLWLISRSPFERGTQYCPMARYIENHAGPYGYGFQRKAISIPLVTGTYAHTGIELILKWIIEARVTTGVQPTEAPAEVIRWAIQEAQAKYDRTIEKRGFFMVLRDSPEGNERMAYLIEEQKYLIEGLTWAWCLYRLPQILAEYLIVAVEEEEELVLDCTCSLGSGIGTVQEHEARSCNGIGYLSRPDVLACRHSDGKYTYIEFKTASVAKKHWNDSWERKQQFIMGILGAERRHGVEITHAWVEGLVKGQRKADQWKGDPNAQRIQQSPFVHPYYSAGLPPDAMPQWRPSYNYITAEGVEFVAGKKEGYKKTPIWTIPREVGWPGIPEEMSVIEYWVRVMINEYPDHVTRQLNPIGPLPKQRHMVEKAVRSVICEERSWQDKLWRIYDYSQRTGKEWGDDEFMAFVETVVPRSWNCDPYGPEHPCSNQVVCHPITDDWRKPIESGLFVFRTPHHEAEAQQMAARGLKPEFGLGEDQEEVEAED